jgi:hypothetical protein
LRRRELDFVVTLTNYTAERGASSEQSTHEEHHAPPVEHGSITVQVIGDHVTMGTPLRQAADNKHWPRIKEALVSIGAAAGRDIANDVWQRG